jgi:hypothetical protein
MSVKYPDIHKTRQDRLLQHKNAPITKIVNRKPDRSEGVEGDIAVGNTRDGIKLYIKTGNKWNTFSPDTGPLSRYSSKDYTTNRTITGITSALDTTDVLATLINDLIIMGILGKNNKKTVAFGSPLDWLGWSDSRMKDNQSNIENAVDKVEKLNGISFTWNDKNKNKSGKKDLGVISQEVQKIFPELVEERDNGMLTVSYNGLIPLLIEAVKELKTEIEILKDNKK